MFSNNGKISNHQTVRLLILDVFTGATLFLPMALGRISGGAGIASFILGLLFTLANGGLLAWSFRRSGGDYIGSLGRRRGGRIFQYLYGLRCFASLVFLMGLYSSVLKDTFLYMTPKWLIIAGMVIVLIYGAGKGIEVRARLSEMLFYLVLIPIILIGLFSLPEGDVLQLVNFSGSSGRGIIEGALVTWIVMAPLEWMLYIVPAQADDRFFKNFAWALIIGGGLVLLIYVLCVCVLTVPGMASETWPTVILMQIVRIPGGFMSRQDGLMLSFWIFAMFVSLSGALSHGARLWKFTDRGEKNWKVWLLSGAGGILAWFVGMDRKFLDWYFWGMLISGLFLLWLIPWIYSIKGKRGKRGAAAVLAVLIMLGLTGCENYVELENRAFVMALGVDKGEEGTYKFTYAFPDIQALTGKEGGEKQPAVSLEGDSLSACKEKYNSMSNKSMDYGQVKVLVVGKALAEDSVAMGDLLEEMKANPEFARTILVCMSLGSGEEILALDEEVEGSIGIYLDNMFRNNGEQLGIEPVILNDVLCSASDGILTMEVPQLYVYDKKPRFIR